MKGVNPRIEDYRKWSIECREEDPERAELLLTQSKNIQFGESLKEAIKREQEDRLEYPEDYLHSIQTLEQACDYDAPLVMRGWAYSGRNYDLFAILADVRNGRGFAGCTTGDGFNPISDPRGFPDNASPEYQAIVESWDSDAHSHSFHTLTQLKEYDWANQKTTHRGYVSEFEYKDYKEKGKFGSYSGDVFGGAIVKINNEQMDALLSGKTMREEGMRYYTQIEWDSSYEEAAGTFVPKTIPLLESISEDGIGYDVRIVFFFDN